MDWRNGYYRNKGWLGIANNADLIPLQEALVTAVGTSNQIIITPDTVADTITFSTPQSIGTTSSPTFADLIVRKLKGSGSAPTYSFVGANGAGAQGTPTNVVMAGTDLAFTFSFTSGTTCTAAAIAKITFVQPFAAVPIVFMFPMNRLTSSTQTTVAKATTVANVTVNDFVLDGGSSTALVDSSAYSWGFMVVGK